MLRWVKHTFCVFLCFVVIRYRPIFPCSSGLLHTLLWRHNERDSVSNHQRLYCLLKRLFRRRSKVTSKLRVTGLCAWNSPGTGEFPAQKASNAENVSIWWRHHEMSYRGYMNAHCQRNNIINGKMNNMNNYPKQNTAQKVWIWGEIYCIFMHACMHALGFDSQVLSQSPTIEQTTNH